jgi:hypothetical protein
MNKTVLFADVDGHEVISGFGEPVIDPVETAKVVNAALPETDEYKALEAKKAQYAEAATARAKAAHDRDQKAYDDAMAAMRTYQEETKPLAEAYSEKIYALRRELAVYFEPKPGEVMIADDEVKKLSEAIKNRPDGVFIKRDGSQVKDNRGTVYFRKVSKKWQRTQVVRLGDTIPKDAVLEADLTPEQKIEIERDRVAALPDTDKGKEKDAAIKDALKAAADMRSSLEIQGDVDALAKSQTQYNAEVKRIEGLYGK